MNLTHEQLALARAEEVYPHLRRMLLEEFRPRKWVTLHEAAEQLGRTEHSLRGLWKRNKDGLRGVMRKEGSRVMVDVFAFERWQGTE